MPVYEQNSHAGPDQRKDNAVPLMRLISRRSAEQGWSENALFVSYLRARRQIPELMWCRDQSDRLDTYDYDCNVGQPIEGASNVTKVPFTEQDTKRSWAEWWEMQRPDSNGSPPTILSGGCGYVWSDDVHNTDFEVKGIICPPSDIRSMVVRISSWQVSSGVDFERIFDLQNFLLCP